MIFFTNNQSVINAIPNIRNKAYQLLSMSPYSKLKYYYNISSLISVANQICNPNSVIAGNGIRYVDPNIQNMVYESPEFDAALMNYIDNDKQMWLSMMLIMITTYEGYDVIIEYNNDEFSSKVVESLIKIIQEKYQYNCLIANYIDDIYSCNESSFGPAGLLKLDEERRRYQEMVIAKEIDFIIGDIPIE